MIYNIFSLRFSSFIILALALSFTSCHKDEKNALKEIAGTWNIQSFTLNNVEPDGVTAEGTWTFDSCKRKDNKKGKCTGQFDYTLSYTGGNTEIYNQNFNYYLAGVSKNDLASMIIDDLDTNINITGNTMTATSVIDGETIIYTFTR